MISVLMLIVGSFMTLFGAVMLIMNALTRSKLWGAVTIGTFPLGGIFYALAIDWDESRLALAFKLTGAVILAGGIWLGMETNGVVAEALEKDNMPWASRTTTDSEEPGLSAQEEAAIEAAQTVPLQTGRTMQEVNGALGAPTKGSGVQGKQILWFYHSRTITFENGRVISDVRHK